MIPKKIFAWVLIVLGLLLIIFGLYYSYNIFTGKSSVPEVFKIAPETQNTTGSSNQDPGVSNDKNPIQQGIEKEMEKLVSDQVKNVIPQEMIYKILNLLSWSIFTAILFLGGGKISSIGALMLKN